VITDIKPGNIGINLKNNKTISLVLLDFGGFGVAGIIIDQVTDASRFSTTIDVQLG